MRFYETEPAAAGRMIQIDNESTLDSGNRLSNKINTFVLFKAFSKSHFLRKESGRNTSAKIFILCRCINKYKKTVFILICVNTHV